MPRPLRRAILPARVSRSPIRISLRFSIIVAAAGIADAVTAMVAEGISAVACAAMVAVSDVRVCTAAASAHALSAVLALAVAAITAAA